MQCNFSSLPRTHPFRRSSHTSHQQATSRHAWLLHSPVLQHIIFMHCHDTDACVPLVSNTTPMHIVHFIIAFIIALSLHVSAGASLHHTSDTHKHIHTATGTTQYEHSHMHRHTHRYRHRHRNKRRHRPHHTHIYTCTCTAHWQQAQPGTLCAGWWG